MGTIADNIQILYDIKENIKNAIEGRGVDVGEAPFTEYSIKINEIPKKTPWDKFVNQLELDLDYISDVWVYLLNRTNPTTNSGIMFKVNGKTPISTMRITNYNQTYPNYEYINYMGGAYALNYGTSLIKPWTYDEGNSPSTTPITDGIESADLYWFGGFKGDDITYFDEVFTDVPSELVYMEYLRNLGQNVSSVCTLDFSPTNLNTDALNDIGESVYDFAANGGNINGVTTANVKFNAKVTDDVKNLWSSKGWTIIE